MIRSIRAVASDIISRVDEWMSRRLTIHVDYDNSKLLTQWRQVMKKHKDE